MGLFKNDLNLSRKLVWATLLFILGIIAGYYSYLNYRWSLGFLVGLSLLLPIVYLTKKQAVNILLISLFFAAGLAWIDRYESRLYSLDPWTEQNITVTGQVAEIIPRDYQVVINITDIDGMLLDTSAKVAVETVWGDTNNYGWGDVVRFAGRLKSPLPQVNPGGFSQRDYWRQNGVGYILDAGQKGEILREAKGLKKYTAVAREKIYQLINDHLPQEEGGILLGILLGDKKAMDDDFYLTSQKLGIAHIFAVSGQHVAVLLAFYLIGARLVKLPSWPTIIGAAVLLGSFGLLVGFTPSVNRAIIMGILGLLAVKWLKFKDFYTILAVAALIIILSNPFTLFNAGFQLSFITTWGLYFLTPLVSRLFAFLPQKAALVLAVPIAAHLASMFITLYHFNTVSLLSPLINLIVVPVVSLLVPLLFIAVIFAPLGIISQPFIYLAGGLAYWQIFFIESFTRWFSEGHIYLPRPPLIAVFLYYLALILLKEIDRFKEVIAKIPVRIKPVPVLIFILLLLFWAGTVPKDRNLEVAFLDVGQGDGVVLKTPYNQYVVVDGGPGSTTVSQYLRYKGVNKIALVILSHPDTDHINGLFTVLKEFKVDTILVPPDVEQSEELRQLKTLAREKKTRIVEGRKGVNLRLRPGINFQVLAPGQDYQGLSVNNASLIINCAYNNLDFLFTGDVDKEILDGLLPLNREIEVIKIPHHGSRGSFAESFYQGIKPKVAVISAGRENRYGHPHIEVLEGLKAVGAHIYRTDRQGAVIFSSDGEKLWVKTMLADN
ncbi:MAG: DNA internalization-related competence protein ComEC/Rec2 [Clostridia bacterium]|nr:DNA internalization-related competence protein ComEC/Rec2 [Clostridia bacterium]